MSLKTAIMQRILIIAGDKAVYAMLTALVCSIGHQAEQALSLRQGSETLAGTAFDLVFLDVELPDGNGLEAVSQIKQSPSCPDIIVITGEGTSDGAELAMASGSWDYQQKPLSADRVRLSLTRALQYRQERKAAAKLQLLQRNAVIGGSLPLNEEATLYPIHLPIEIRAHLAGASIPPPSLIPAVPEAVGRKNRSFRPLREVLDTVTKQYLIDLIGHAGGDIKEICRVSGISRANIYARLKKFQITRRL